MHKADELRHAKRHAMLCLAIAGAFFMGALLAPRNGWSDAVKAMAEAALVGALADWFAVAALFRRIPIPFIAAHTAIIPRNKNRIADSLAAFVQEKFLDPTSVAGLIAKHDPAQKLADWLNAPGHAGQLGGHVLRLLRGMLDVVDDARIQSVMRDAAHAMLDRVDFSKSAGVMLDGLTRNGRHQELLDQGIAQLMLWIGLPETRQFINDQIVGWLKEEHPIKEKMLPTEWLGKNGADLISTTVNALLDDIERNDRHSFRLQFDEFVLAFIERLKQDPVMAAKAEEVKRYLKTDATFNTYIKELWGSVRGWLRQDLERADSRLHQQVTAAGNWLGRAIDQDPGLRASLNLHMTQAARGMAPDFAAFLTRHISDTVKGWDTRDMSRQIELNIGKDLQYIRINGTIVGGCIGLALYLISSLPTLLRG